MTTTLVLEQSARTVITEAGGTTLVQESASTATRVQTQSGQGPAGAGAYQTAVLLGFVGDEAAWLASLHGADGEDGASAYEIALAEGFVGSQSAWVASLAGTDGASAYAIALASGFVGSQSAWLASLEGAPGTDGTDGASAYAIAVAAGFVGSEAAWLLSLNGTNGDDGTDGLSAYQLALANGFVGTEAAWLASLQGTDGADGVGVPAGGAAGTVLTKVSGADHDTAWRTLVTRGTASIDFGASASDASTVITGQADIASSSIVRAWVSPIATADHSVDEHIVEPLRVFAHSIVDGVGFTVSAVCDLGLTSGEFSISWEWT